MASVLVGVPARAAESPGTTGAACGPIPAEPAALVVAASEPGVRPSDRNPEGAGEIVPLPVAGGASHAREVPGEALLALPKAADGSIPTGFELVRGASVADSFFSAVLCATVVRVVGPPELKPSALVTRTPDTAVAVPNHVYVTSATEVRELPAGGDPYRPLQWGLEQSGAVAAWSAGDGGGARVAILDSAPDTSHRDLSGIVLAPLPGAPPAPVGVHGSLMAGVVRAVAGNDFGIAGLAPGSEVIAVPVCRPSAAGDGDECPLFDLLRGVDLAWERGAQVMNLSLVGPPNPLLRKAMDRLEEIGVLSVAAVGNEAVDEPRYPAAYPSVIGVGALDRSGRPYARGNRGTAVEILAPGVEILSTVPGGAFAFGDGTSLAAAHASGVLALAIAAGSEPLAARAAFFEAARARAETPDAQPARLPTACEVLARLGKPCP